MVGQPVKAAVGDSPGGRVVAESAATEIVRPSEIGEARSTIDAFEGRWFVLHTRARQEKAVAEDLGRLNIRHFLPLVRYRRIHGGRVRPVSIPLFPGYVFMCGRDEDRVAALRTHRVANILSVADQERLKADLRQIQRVVESNEPVDLFPRLRKGTRCRVIRGTLSGIEGVVLRRRGPWRVYVGVDFVGQSAELEIDPSFLAIID